MMLFKQGEPTTFQAVALSSVTSLEKTHAGRDLGQEEKGMTEDEMAGWHHRLDGREFE